MGQKIKPDGTCIEWHMMQCFKCRSVGNLYNVEIAESVGAMACGASHTEMDLCEKCLKLFIGGIEI